MAQTAANVYHDLPNSNRVFYALLAGAGIDVTGLVNELATAKARIDAEYPAADETAVNGALASPPATLVRAGTAMSGTALIEQENRPIGKMESVYEWLRNLRAPYRAENEATWNPTAASPVAYDSEEVAIKQVENIQMMYDLYATAAARWSV